MTDTWSPSTYLQFHDERTRAARDLLAHVPLESAASIVDVGCGPGNSTAPLAARYPDASLLGVDSSPAMLERARAALPHARFELADASEWRPPPDIDLVFANAIYQWVPNHLAVLTATLAALHQGAVLAVQMPENVAEPTHRLMQETAAAGPWAARHYTARIARAYPPAVDGRVLLRFPRLFIVAVR